MKHSLVNHRNSRTLLRKSLPLFPAEINRLRDIKDHYSVDETYEILHANQLLSREYKFKESLSTSLMGQSAEGETQMEKALRSMTEKSSNAFPVYTCPPIAIVHTKGDGFNRFMVIDTHKVSDEVSGNDNGVITFADYCEQQLPNVTKELARWIRNRIATSVRRPVPQSLLHVDLQRGDVQLEGSDNEDGLLTALDDFEKTQETQGGGGGQQNRQRPCSNR